MPRRALRGLIVCGLAAVLALSWRHGLFLIVVAMPAAAITLSAHARQVDRTHARRAAALALVAPIGVADRAALERIVTADLAAASLGDCEIIDGARSLAEELLADPWQRALACERLQAARAIVIGKPSTRGETRAAWRRPWVRIFGVLVAASALAAGIVTGQKALLAPLALAFTALALAFSEVRRANGVRAQLVRQATTVPAKGLVFVPDAAVVAAVRSLTSTNPRVRATASSIIEASPGPERLVASRRLEAEPISHARISLLDRDIAAVGLAAALFTILLEFL